jgi:hypothetical protein
MTTHACTPAQTAAPVALLAPTDPLPPPWCTDPTGPPCDLCGHASQQLWTLVSNPTDDLPAGELLICRSCATAIRPPQQRPAAPATRARRRSRSVAHAMSERCTAPTLT